MKRGLFLQPDVSAGTAWDPFRRELPPSPKTKKGRPARQPSSSDPSSLPCVGSVIRHDPNRTTKE